MKIRKFKNTEFNLFLAGFWWLVRATYVVDGRLFGHFFGRWWGAVRIHINHVQLPYTVINMWGINVGGGINMCNVHGN